MAQWEAERGYRSTYFILHTAPYWQEKDTLQAALEIIAGCGHEIGFHINAISEAITTGRDPLTIAAEPSTNYAATATRSTASYLTATRPATSTASSTTRSSPRARGPYAACPDRWVAGVKLEPVSRATLGFDYDPNWLPRAVGVSDSGGRWSQPFEESRGGLPV
jgi:hypothetical protein